MKVKTDTRLMGMIGTLAPGLDSITITPVRIGHLSRLPLHTMIHGTLGIMIPGIHILIIMPAIGVIPIMGTIPTIILLTIAIRATVPLPRINMGTAPSAPRAARRPNALSAQPAAGIRKRIRV